MKTVCCLCILLALPGPAVSSAREFVPPLDGSINRPWLGADLWANPMEDWKLENGAAINTHSGGDRNVTLLTAGLSARNEPFSLSCDFRPLATDSKSGFIGFQAGLRGDFDDYRDSAIYGTGFAAGIDAAGYFFVGALKSPAPLLKPGDGPLRLTLSGQPTSEGRFDVRLSATPAGDDSDGAAVVSFHNPSVHPSWIEGLVSFTVSNLPPANTLVAQPRPERVPAIAQQRGGDWRFALSEIKIGGAKFDLHPERAFGPILWTQHSLQNGTLVLTVQFTPVDSEVPARLEIDGRTFEAAIDPRARLARFTVEGIDSSRDHPYTINWNGTGFAATLRAEPSAKDDLTVVAMSCNDSTGFPHQALVANVAAHQPDLIAFLGDQIYEPIGGYGHLLGENNTDYDDRVALCYLRKYYMHGWSWGPLLSEVPSITIPDDHDVFHGNIWGAGGMLADRSKDSGAGAQDSGGYKLSPKAVNAVHLTQTGNLPPPADATPADNGISIYFTRWAYAGIDMAVLADRQFKSAPRDMLPEARIFNGWPQNKDYQHPGLKDPKVFDINGAELLGKRQEEFLADWAANPAANSRWRLVFSQSPFGCAHTLPAGEYSDAAVPGLETMQPREYPPDDIVKVDFDANGWPQTRRDFAVRQLGKAGALHIAGDQHLGMTGRYGIDTHNDAGWWIATPAIANIWPRRWFPRDGGEGRREGDPKYTGRFLDGFGNRITVDAVANPQVSGRQPARLFDRAVGYTVVTLHRGNGRITMANWSYTSAPNLAAPDNRPYPGWPITIDPKSGERIE